MNELKAELQKLYSDASKHSVYQNVPDFVSAELGYNETIDETWRGDRPRLAYLLNARTPAASEIWTDFGANTGFFTLSLAHRFPQTLFIAIEANPNHAHFIKRVAQYFSMGNVEVIQRAVGLADLNELPPSDFLLHLNVLHHAGHDFDAELVPGKDCFADYARRYLELLRKRASSMLFQLGYNWGGDKQQPLVDVQGGHGKLETFSEWLRSAGWHLTTVAYAIHSTSDKVRYQDLSDEICKSLRRGDTSHGPALQAAFNSLALDRFPGEFYHRPLFICDDAIDTSE